MICLWDLTTFDLLRRVKYGSLPIINFTPINNDYMLIANDSNIEGVLIAALNKHGNLIKFLFPLADHDTTKFRVYSSPRCKYQNKLNNAFTLYSASSINALEAKKLQYNKHEKYVLSHIIMDHQQGRLWIGYKNPLCLQSITYIQQQQRVLNLVKP